MATTISQQQAGALTPYAQSSGVSRQTQLSTSQIAESASRRADIQKPRLLNPDDRENIIAAFKDQKDEGFWRSTYKNAFEIQKKQNQAWKVFRQGLVVEADGERCRYAAETFQNFKIAYTAYEDNGRRELEAINEKISSYTDDGSLRGHVETLPYRRPELENPAHFDEIRSDRQLCKLMSQTFSWAYSVQLFRNIWMSVPADFKQSYDSVFIRELKAINESITALSKNLPNKKGKNTSHRLGCVFIPRKGDMRDYPRYDNEFTSGDEGDDDDDDDDDDDEDTEDADENFLKSFAEETTQSAASQKILSELAGPQGILVRVLREGIKNGESSEFKKAIEEFDEVLKRANVGLKLQDLSDFMGVHGDTFQLAQDANNEPQDGNLQQRYRNARENAELFLHRNELPPILVDSMVPSLNWLQLSSARELDEIVGGLGGTNGVLNAYLQSLVQGNPDPKRVKAMEIINERLAKDGNGVVPHIPVQGEFLDQMVLDVKKFTAFVSSCRMDVTDKAAMNRLFAFESSLLKKYEGFPGYAYAITGDSIHSGRYRTPFSDNEKVGSNQSSMADTVVQPQAAQVSAGMFGGPTSTVPSMANTAVQPQAAQVSAGMFGGPTSTEPSMANTVVQPQAAQVSAGMFGGPTSTVPSMANTAVQPQAAQVSAGMFGGPTSTVPSMANTAVQPQAAQFPAGMFGGSTSAEPSTANAISTVNLSNAILRPRSPEPQPDDASMHDFGDGNGNDEGGDGVSAGPAPAEQSGGGSNFVPHNFQPRFGGHPQNIRGVPRTVNLGHEREHAEGRVMPAPPAEHDLSQFRATGSKPGIVCEEVNGVPVEKTIISYRPVGRRRSDDSRWGNQLCLKYFVPGGYKYPAFQFVPSSDHKTSLEEFIGIGGKEFVVSGAAKLVNITWSQCKIGGVCPVTRDEDETYSNAAVTYMLIETNNSGVPNWFTMSTLKARFGNAIVKAKDQHMKATGQARPKDPIPKPLRQQLMSLEAQKRQMMGMLMPTLGSRERSKLKKKVLREAEAMQKLQTQNYLPTQGMMGPWGMNPWTNNSTLMNNGPWGNNFPGMNRPPPMWGNAAQYGPWAAPAQGPWGWNATQQQGSTKQTAKKSQYQHPWVADEENAEGPSESIEEDGEEEEEEEEAEDMPTQADMDFIDNTQYPPSAFFNPQMSNNLQMGYMPGMGMPGMGMPGMGMPGMGVPGMGMPAMGGPGYNPYGYA